MSKLRNTPLAETARRINEIKGIRAKLLRTQDPAILELIADQLRRVAKEGRVRKPIKF